MAQERWTKRSGDHVNPNILWCVTRWQTSHATSRQAFSSGFTYADLITTPRGRRIDNEGGLLWVSFALVTSRRFGWIESAVMGQRPAVLVAVESCRDGNSFSRILSLSLGVCSVWVRILLISSPALCRTRAVLQGLHRVSRRVNQGCPWGHFLHVLTQTKIQKTDMVFRSGGSRKCCGGSFSLLDANERRINTVCYVRVPLVAKIKYAQTWEIAWQQNWTAWEEMQVWAAEMTSGLQSGDKPSANNCQRQSFPFCSRAVLNTRKISNRHVSLYCWTLKINFILKINWGFFFFAGCVVWHREAIQFCDICLLQYRTVGNPGLDTFSFYRVVLWLWCCFIS